MVSNVGDRLGHYYATALIDRAAWARPMLLEHLDGAIPFDEGLPIARQVASYRS